jgi:hypothetical protein
MYRSLWTMPLLDNRNESEDGKRAYERVFFHSVVRIDRMYFLRMIVNYETPTYLNGKRKPSAPLLEKVRVIGHKREIKRMRDAQFIHLPGGEIDSCFDGGSEPQESCR